MPTPPILDNKDPAAASVFEPAALLRDARRQKSLAAADMPALCFLDPDGDIVRRLRDRGEAIRSPAWPCYHTDLYEFTIAGRRAGIVGCAVGAPFAVLVAEELFACGCRMLVSLTSAGQIVPAGRVVTDALGMARLPAYVGASWTTDAQFRETATAVAAAQEKRVLAVEMEAAALYAFARAREKAVLCLAHVTNTMGLADQDFEKGEEQGATDALKVLEALTEKLFPA